MSNFVYSPLNGGANWIRLLVISPPTADNPNIIHCSLHDTCLGTSPLDRYEALSYTWGDPVPGSEPRADRLIQLNEQPFLVRYNIWSALHHLRLHTRPRTVWIDAICVDQTNLYERSQQVAQMQNVYRSAACVIVWLGEAADDSELACELLKQAASIAKEGAQPKSDNILHPEFYQTYLTETSGRPDLVEAWVRGQRALAKLFERSWWRRVWVVQEVVFGRAAVVRCGYSELNWEGLRQAWKFVFGLAKKDLVLLGRGNITLTINQLKHKMASLKDGVADILADREDLFGLLHKFRRLSASDPRDHVFTLLHFGSQLIPIDYNKEPVTIFLETAVALSKRTADLTLLAYVDGTWYNQSRSRGALEHLPSWVPNWAEPQHSITLFGSRYNSNVPYRASNGLDVPNRVDTRSWRIEGGQLHTRALHIGRVITLGIKDARNRSEFCLDACHVAEKTAIGTRSVPFEHIVRTLLANRLQKGESLPNDAFEGVTAYEDLSKDMHSCISYLRYGRRFAVLSTGSIGLVPGQAKRGDRMYIIPGCLVPILLRKKRLISAEDDDDEDDEENYDEDDGHDSEQMEDVELESYREVIGSCYVHGIMEGEAAELAKTLVPNTWQWDQLSII